MSILSWIDLLGKRFADDDKKPFSAKLLLTIVSSFPTLLRGSEEQLQILLEEKSLIDAMLIKILVKAAAHISVKFRKHV